MSCQSKLGPTWVSKGRISYRQTSGWQLPIRERSMNPDHFTAARRKTSLDELPSSGEFGRIRSVHLRKGFRAQL